MQTWSRLITYARRYWRRFALSLVFGIMAAAAWGLELGLTYPITVMFGPHQNLPDFVRHEIETWQQRVRDYTTSLEIREKKLEATPDDGSQDHKKERTRLLFEIRQHQQKLDNAASRVWLMSWIETRIIPRLPRDQFAMFAAIFGLILVVTLIKGLCSIAQDVLAGGVAELVVIDLRQDLFRRTLKLDPQTVSLGGPQRLMSDFTTTMQQLAVGLGELGGRIVREPLKAIACLIAMFCVNWQLTMILIAFVPLAGWMFHIFGQRMKRAVRRLMESVGRIYKSLEETFINAKAVIAFNRSAWHRRQFHRRNREFYDYSMKLARIDALSGAFVEFLTVFAVTAVLLPAAYLALRGATSIAGIKLATVPPNFNELAMFYALLAGVIDPLRKFSRFYITIQRAGTQAEQIFQQMDRPSLVPIAAEPQWLPRLEGNIEFRNIHFKYARAADDHSPERGDVLAELNLTIPCGETVAIVGSNGSGKSTLLGLLPRFYDPDHGSILFDGVDLRNVRTQDLRDQIAIVPQETLLFDDTIESNIRYGKPNASKEDLDAALKKSHVIDFAEGLPQKLATPVGEGGRQLSGGQRQRIALARAILRNPRVLILDEPTAAVDAESERLIHRALKDFVRDRTTFIITHSLTPTLLEYVTRIVVMDRGRVAAIGTHQELSKSCPIYNQLFESQPRVAA